MPEVGTVWTFDYTGKEQTFKVGRTGTYKLETWGAQGNSINQNSASGVGGYSVGNIELAYREVLYISVGDQKSGFNGGGLQQNDFNLSNGGGATHIAKISGILSNLSLNLEEVIIVAGGGGSDSKYSNISLIPGGSGGGLYGGNPYYANYAETTYVLSNNYGATQNSSGVSSPTDDKKYCSPSFPYPDISINRGSFGIGAIGSGGGWYGGAYYRLCNRFYSGSGGSGYIGNSLLYNKAMYCYNCEESTEESTKTISTTCTSKTPTENCSKQGNGYARITFISY